jgi:hypothetical protein
MEKKQHRRAEEEIDDESCSRLLQPGLVTFK